MKTSKWMLAFIVSLVGLGAGVLVLNGKTKPAASLRQAGKTLYQCSMHPQIIQDHPGDCPICHMHLEKVVDEGDGRPEITHAAAKKVTKYRNPMDPTVFSDHPMKDSMGMDYVPVYEEDAGELGTTDVPGKGSFTLSPGRQQLIGVRWTPVKVQDVGLTLRLPARVSGGRDILAELLEMDGGRVKRGDKALLKGPGGEAVAATVVSV